MMLEITVERALAVLATDSLKGALLLSVAGLTVAAWRGASASSRHLIWTAGVIATIALPAVGFLLPGWRSPELAIRVSDSRAATPAFAARVHPETAAPLTMSPSAAAIVTPQPPTQRPLEVPARLLPIASPAGMAPEIMAPSSAISRPAPTESLRASVINAVRTTSRAEIVLAVWFAGFVLVLLPFCTGRLRLRHIAASARPATDGRWIDILDRMRAAGTTTRRVALLESHDAAMPMTWGVISPVLLIPAITEEWPEWKCRDILLHELAHIERFDCLTQMVARVACAIYWFNPLVWMAAHRMRVERELACDDRVINNGSRPSDYATHLLDVALSLRPPRATAQAAIAMARPSQLSGRLTAVLDRERNRQKASLTFRAAIGAATLGVLLPVASFSPFVAEVVAAPSKTAFRLPPVDVRAESPRDTATAIAREATSNPDTTSVMNSTPSHATTGFVVATTSGAVASTVVATSAGGGFAFRMATTPIRATADVAAMLFPGAQNAECWESKREGSNHVSINNDGSGTDRTTVAFSSGDCTLEIRAEGKFTIRPDLSDLANIERGGFFTIEERMGRNSRRMEIRPGSGGLEHVYYVDGRRSEYSAEARSWLAGVLLATERRTAFAASTRAPQIFEGSGAKGVLDEVSLMQSDYAKAAYLGVLFKQGVNFDAPTLTRVVRQSTREMTSDYYLAEVFNLVGAQKFTDENTWRAFADATAGIKSDYYKAQVIGKVLSRDRLDPGTISALLKAASTIASDYYRSETLISLAKRGHLDATTRHDYFGAVRNIGSDYYKHAALNASLTERPLSRETVAELLAVAPSIKSDFELSGLLASLAQVYPIDNSLRPAWDKAVDAIESSYYRGAALDAARRPAAR